MHYARWKNYRNPFKVKYPQGLVCSVSGCCGYRKSLGMCNRHYLRFKRHGDPNKGGTPRDPTRLCKVGGCCVRARRNGLCSTHSSRFRRHGDPLKVLLEMRRWDFPATNYELRKQDPRVFLYFVYRTMLNAVRGNHRGRVYRRGKKISTIDEFISWGSSHPGFIRLYSDWQMSGFNPNLLPSCFRVNPSAPYTTECLRWATRPEVSQYMCDGRYIGRQVTL